MSASQKTYENSVLQLGVLRKIEQIAETSAKQTVAIKDQIILQNVAVSGMSSLIKKQNKILEDIREAVLSAKNDSDANKKAKSDVLSGTPIAKLAAAAGLVAVMALGLWTMGMVFDSLKNLPPKAIYNAIGVALAMIPITKAFSMIIESMPSSLLVSPKLMLNITGSLIVMALGFAAFGFAMKLTPILEGKQLIGSLAIAGVVLVMGYVYAALLERLTSTGFVNYLMNKNKTNKAMQSMLTIALALVGIGFALRLAPRVTIKQAAAFVILSAVMLPMALTFVALKFAFFLSRKVTVKDVIRTTGMMSIVAAALIPIGYAAALIPSLSPDTAKNLRNLSPILLPLAAVATLIAAMQQKKASKGLMKGMIPAGAEPNEDKKKFDPKVIMYVALGMVAVVAAMVGVAYIVSKSGPVLNSATQVMAGLNYKGLFGMLGLITVGAIMVALVVNIMRGRGSSKSATGLKSVIGGTMESTQGTIKTNDMIVAAATIPVVALGILAAAWVFQGLPGTFVSPDVMWTLKAGLSIFLFGMAIAKISNATKKLKTNDLIKGTVVSLAVALLITAVAHLFSAYPGDPSLMPSLKFIAMAAATILIFAIPFALITLAVKRVKGKDMGKAVISMAFIAVAIIGVAFLFQYLDMVDAYVAPPLDWTLKAGLALVLFSASFIAIAVAAKAIKIKGILMGMIGMAAIAVGILGVAWIFSVLPDAYFAPPLDWTIQTLLTLVLFSVPIAIIGAIATSGVGALAILLGVVGLIVIAAGIWVVAWIFNKIPDVTGVAENLTTAILTPVNKMIDILARLKNEIGIDNLIPLAGGIVAISGSLLVLGAAVAGMAVGGFAASMANLGSAIADFFSGKDTKGPMETLKELISLAPGIEKLPGPLEKIATAVSVSDIMQLVEALGKFGTAIIKISKTGDSSAFETTMDRLKDLSKYDFSDQAKDLDAIAKAYNKIADTTNKINVEAMDSTTNMFKALAYLSEKGGKSAIEALGENLIEAVEELANMIANFEGTVKEQSESNSGVAKSIGGFADSVKSGVGSLFGFGSSEPSPADNNAEVARQMKKLVSMLQTGDAKIIIADVKDSAAQKLA